MYVHWSLILVQNKKKGFKVCFFLKGKEARWVKLHIKRKILKSKVTCRGDNQKFKKIVKLLISQYFCEVGDR